MNFFFFQNSPAGCSSQDQLREAALCQSNFNFLLWHCSIQSVCSTELLRQGKAEDISAKLPALPAAGAAMEGSQEQELLPEAHCSPRPGDLQQPSKQLLNPNMLPLQTERMAEDCSHIQQCQTASQEQSHR